VLGEVVQNAAVGRQPRRSDGESGQQTFGARLVLGTAPGKAGERVVELRSVRNRNQGQKSKAEKAKKK
jgi:hypothetical protein